MPRLARLSRRRPKALARHLGRVRRAHRHGTCACGVDHTDDAKHGNRRTRLPARDRRRRDAGEHG